MASGFKRCGVRGNTIGPGESEVRRFDFVEGLAVEFSREAGFDDMADYRFYPLFLSAQSGANCPSNRFVILARS